MSKEPQQSNILSRRIGALFFDGLFISLIQFLTFWLILALPEPIRLKYSTVLATTFVILLLTLKPLYEILTYQTQGQSLGKKAFGLKIVNSYNNQNLSFLRISLRELTKYLLYSMLGLIIYIAELIKVNTAPYNITIIDTIFTSQVISITENHKGKRSIAVLIITFITAIILFFWWLVSSYSGR